MGLRSAEDDEDDAPEDLFHQEGPILLLGFGMMSQATFQHLPPKPIADQLIARFFQGKEPAWRKIASPRGISFQVALTKC
jgi:hypothetical protein